MWYTTSSVISCEGISLTRSFAVTDRLEVKRGQSLKIPRWVVNVIEDNQQGREDIE
jgi:hypothetical protein